MRNLIKYSLLTACACVVSACGFFDKDNTPAPHALVSFKPTVQPRLAWKTSTGSGAGSDYLRLAPGMNDRAIFTASTNGQISAIAKNNGNTLWRTQTGYTLSTGPGIGDGIVVVGSMHGSIIALSEATGKILWRSNVKGELLANPAVGSDHVIVKAIDGTVTAFAVSDGSQLWSFKQSEPDLILRGASAPLVHDGKVLTGFANGNLVSASLSSGDITWVQQLAIPEGGFAIERMIDIDADPIIDGHRIFAATYQGNIASLDWRSGRELWKHQLSSYTGMTVDNNHIYVSDARSLVWSFGIDDGGENWRQNDLYARNISGPAEMGNYIVVGDAQGYLHWLNKRDGSFAARESLGSGILAKPLYDGHRLYVLANNGTLAAYQFG